MGKVRTTSVILALALVGLAAPPAVAGGPTSVMLVSPETGQTASLYYSDPRYERLSVLVGNAHQNEAGAPDAALGAGVTVTWLIHDIHVWRVDRIYLDGDGGARIATQMVDGSASGGETPVAWHAAKDGAALASLLERLGVLAGEGPPAERPVVAPVPAVQPTAAPVPAATSAARTSTAASGVAWVLAGLVVGSLLTLVGMRARRRPAVAAPTHDRVDTFVPTRPRVAGQTVHSIMGAREGRGVDVLEQ